jgi:hypothetical protein
MDPGRQWEGVSRPSLDQTFRTSHGQQREGERGVPPEMVAKILRDGVQTPDRNRPGNTIYHYHDPQTGERFKVAHDPSRGTIPTVTRDPGKSPEEQSAEMQRARDQNRAVSQGQHQERVNKAAQAEKQARRDWANRFPGEFPGMDGYKAAKAKKK